MVSRVVASQLFFMHPIEILPSRRGLKQDLKCIAGTDNYLSSGPCVHYFHGNPLFPRALLLTPVISVASRDRPSCSSRSNVPVKNSAHPFILESSRSSGMSLTVASSSVSSSTGSLGKSILRGGRFCSQLMVHSADCACATRTL